MSFVEGTVLQVLFHNEESSYSVIKLSDLNTDDQDLLYAEPTLIVCGFFPLLEKNVRYRFVGNTKEHPKYGLQFDAKKWERIIENSKEGLIDYLSGDLFKGIGPKTAEAIINQLGVDAINIILNDPNVLDTIPRMNLNKKEQLVETLRENRKLERSLVWLYGFQVSPRLAMKIYQIYGSNAKSIIEENPYTLMEDIEGVGFKRADEIALRIGFSAHHPLRIKAVILYLISEYSNKYGDTFVAMDELVKYTFSYLHRQDEEDVSDEEIKNYIEELSMEEKIVLEDQKVSMRYLYFAEMNIAQEVLRFSKQEPNIQDSDLILNTIIDIQKMIGIDYTKEQIQAIHKALLSAFCIITGGPGTGKTTIINAITKVYSLLNGKKKVIALAAPTGKAAKRLSEATSMSASTIHRLLEYDYSGQFNVSSEMPLDIDLLIIDEASMLDTMLAYHLFQSIPVKTKVIIVGDKNQLPSVGPGQVLNDLIKTDLFEVISLKQVHRQSKGSSIISLAYDILNQNYSQNLMTDYEDRRFVKTYDNQVLPMVLETIDQAIKEGYSLQEDIQILAPMYRGAYGIDELNRVIQHHFNAANKAFKLEYKDKIFYYKDKVLQLSNQPEDHIMNGDVGIITAIHENHLIVDFSSNEVKYDLKDLDNLSLAYAMSIHKAQGSEFKMVVMPLVRSYQIMLKRKLLYTAVTRAKEQLVMIGDPIALERGVRYLESDRKTRILDMVATARDQAANLLTIEDFL